MRLGHHVVAACTLAVRRHVDVRELAMASSMGDPADEAHMIGWSSLAHAETQRETMLRVDRPDGAIEGSLVRVQALSMFVVASGADRLHFLLSCRHGRVVLSLRSQSLHPLFHLDQAIKLVDIHARIAGGALQ